MALCPVDSSHLYSRQGSLHQQALFSIALVLFLFILLVNAALNLFLKRDGQTAPRKEKSAAKELADPAAQPREEGASC